jgi:cytochrome c oxidase subunit 2
MRDEKTPLLKMFGIGALASVIGVVIALAIDWFPTPASEKSGEIDTLYDILLIVSVPVFVLVMTVAIYSCIKFRARPGETGDGPPIHGNTKLEIIWVAVPFAIVSVLAAYAWVVLDRVEAKQKDAVQVRVIAQQFAWHFEYPEEGKFVSNELYLPKDRPVEFDIVTRDVLHSFWVPSFRLKYDAVPGLTTHLNITPNKIGAFPIVCTELCGAGHSTMRQEAHVVEPAEFDTWLEDQKSGGEGGGEAPAGGEEQPPDSASASPTIPAG